MGVFVSFLGVFFIVFLVACIMCMCGINSNYGKDKDDREE